MSCVSNVVVIHHACNVYIACITHSAFGTKLCGLDGTCSYGRHESPAVTCQTTLHYMYTTIDRTGAYYIIIQHTYTAATILT